tara:strand:- start:111 stop:359 length:249 start_codon:yes stop_codon:yes gene_type:complete
MFTDKKKPLQTLLESDEDSVRSVCEEIKGHGMGQVSDEASEVASENSQGDSTEEFQSKIQNMTNPTYYQSNNRQYLSQKSGS